MQAFQRRETSGEAKRVAKRSEPQEERGEEFLLSLSPFSSRLASLRRSFHVAGTPACWLQLEFSPHCLQYETRINWIENREWFSDYDSTYTTLQPKIILQATVPHSSGKLTSTVL